MTEIPRVLLTAATSTSPAETGFAGVTPGGRLVVIGGVAGLLLIGLVALVVSLRGSRLGTEGSRRARRGFGPDALDAAARELRPSLAGVTVPQRPDVARIPRWSPVLPTSPVIPEEVRACEPTAGPADPS